MEQELLTLKEKVFQLENELNVTNIKLLLSDQKIQKLQESEFRLEEEIQQFRSYEKEREEKKLIIGQSIFNLIG
jgi:hypothetical protein|tara:strand:+ start:516 stop:737 length:222 start_codon:yes stop_codon:yes gene_type:complete